VDNINENTPCDLHMAMSRKGNTVKVAEAIALPGHMAAMAALKKGCSGR
jgi:hypothetical protein